MDQWYFIEKSTAEYIPNIVQDKDLSNSWNVVLSDLNDVDVFFQEESEEIAIGKTLKSAIFSTLMTWLKR